MGFHGVSWGFKRIMMKRDTSMLRGFSWGPEVTWGMTSKGTAQGCMESCETLWEFPDVFRATFQDFSERSCSQVGIFEHFELQWNDSHGVSWGNDVTTMKLRSPSMAQCSCGCKVNGCHPFFATLDGGTAVCLGALQHVVLDGGLIVQPQGHRRAPWKPKF